MFGHLPFGKGGAFGRNEGTLPDVGMEPKVGVGETDSVAPIWERGTAVGFVETSDTEGAGGSEGSELELELDNGGDDDWAFAKRKEKRTEMITSWKIDADILKNAVFAVAGVADGKEERKRLKDKGETNTRRGGPT